MNHDITPIGMTDFRNERKPFGIKDKDRLGHIYAIGKTGTGKSTLLLNMAVSDIQKGKGLAVIDPHGDIAQSLLDYIPMERMEDIIYFNPYDKEAVPFNPLYNVSPEHRHTVASGIVSAFKNMWPDSWGPRLEYILRYSILTLLHQEKATLLNIQPLLTDAQFRNSVLATVTDENIIAFWKNEFDKYSPSLKSEAISPILNKVGILSVNPVLRRVFGSGGKSISLQSVMDEGKILVANLSKGNIGADASGFIGNILVTSIFNTTLARSNRPENKRTPFYLYIDEAHSFISLSLANILSEARKYGLSLFLAHQYISQMEEEIRDAVFGNVGTLVSFRVGAEDAKHLEREFSPVFNEYDLVNLQRFSMYLKLLIDGATSKPFSAITMPPKSVGVSHAVQAVEMSRKKYGSKPKNEIIVFPGIDVSGQTSLF